MVLSADSIRMDELARHRLIKPETPTDLVGNRLVLIARKGAEPVVIVPGFPLARLVGAGPLAMCDPDSHPAGRYAKASLVKLGIWRNVERKVASVDDPLVAVKNVARGDAPMAVVFATDALTDPAVAIVGTFPSDTHPRIVYPVALLAQSRNPEAVKFFDYLKSPAARSVFRKLGYVTPTLQLDRPVKRR
ncbi:MAG TPA: molybdate ABC transporter substrate-binding protein [Stellaceae bacterium]